MVPISVLEIGDSSIIARIGGKPSVKQHLSDLGFIVGAQVQVVSKLSDNVIVAIKDSRIALDGKLAKDIFVQ